MAASVQGHDRVTFDHQERERADRPARGRRGGNTLAPGRGGHGAGGARAIQPARVLQADIPCANGVVHAVDDAGLIR